MLKMNLSFIQGTKICRMSYRSMPGIIFNSLDKIFPHWPFMGNYMFRSCPFIDINSQTVNNKLFVFLTQSYIRIKQSINWSSGDHLKQNLIIFIPPGYPSINQLKSNHTHTPYITFIRVSVIFESFWRHVVG